MKKNLIILITLIFLNSCGYNSIYSKDKNSNLKINILSMSGDKEMNNLINSEIKRYSRNNSKKEFFIKIDTNYVKTIISKDSSGTAVDYKLELNVNTTINFNKKTQDVYFSEKFNIKNISDKFEQKNYENIIKRNFASSIREKIILKLLSTQ